MKGSTQDMMAALNMAEQYSYAMAVLLIAVVATFFWSVRDKLRRRPLAAFIGGLVVIIGGAVLARNSPSDWQAASDLFHSAMIGLGVSLLAFSITAKPKIDVERIKSLEEDLRLIDPAISDLEKEANRLHPSKDKHDVANSHLRHDVQDRLFDLRLWRRRIEREILKLRSRK